MDQPERSLKLCEVRGRDRSFEDAYALRDGVHDVGVVDERSQRISRGGLGGRIAASAESGADGFTPLAAHLKDLMTPSAIAAATTPGDHRAWAGIWVTDTFKKAVSAHAYPTSLKNGRINP